VRCSVTAGSWCGSTVAIRLQKHTAQKTLKIIVPPHRPVKRSTLAHILKQAQLSAHDFLALVR
jgi:hypothetical protein